MKIETHNIKGINTAEIISEEIILKTVENGLQLLGDLYYQGYDQILIYEKNIIPAFFDLKTKIAGDILQKFAQYQMGLIIIGDFSKYNSQRLNEFIFESNKSMHIHFVSSLEEAKKNEK
jgi:hypothetical protein